LVGADVMADINSSKENLGARKSRIFISYSRKDSAFADRLEAALKARGFDTLIDRAEIYALEDWWKRIEALIARADAVVFVLSPDAVASDICQKEVGFAASLNKRLAPFVYRRVEDGAVPEALARLNFIFFDDETRFEQSLNVLAEALEIDIHWVRKHTEFGEHARRWHAAGRPGPRGLLLRSPVLEEAERWVASRPDGAPALTEAMQAFVAESRRAATQRRNILSGSLGAGLLVALVLAGFAYWQRGIAIEQRSVAVQQRDKALINESRFLADVASQKLRQGDAGTAMLLAMEALPDTAIDSPRPYVPVAELQLGASLRVLREHRILTGHEKSVKSAAFSPDGRRIVTASQDKTARLWDVETGKPISILQSPNVVLDAKFSPDGTRVVTTSEDGTARLWDAATGLLVGLPLTGHEGHVWSVTFSPDGRRIVTGSWDKTVRLWDTTTGEQIGEPLTGFDQPVISAAFSFDGKQIVAVPVSGTARFWDAETREVTPNNTISFGPVAAVAFSSDDTRVVTTSFADTALLWDAETGRSFGVLRGHEGAVTRAAFSSDDQRVVTVSNDKTARVWEVGTGAPIAVLAGHEAAVTSAAFSPDGRRIVTASEDGTVRLWAAENETGPVGAPIDGNVKSAAFSPDGKRIVTAAWGNTAQIWDAETRQPIGPALVHESSLTSAAFSPDGKRIVTASDDGSARLWDAETGQPVGAPLADPSKDDTSKRDLYLFHSAAFGPDGRRVITVSGDAARVWNTETGKVIYKVAIHEISFTEEFARGAAFSPDGKRIVTPFRDKKARLWDAETGQPIAPPLIGHEATVLSAVFSPDGKRIVTASEDKTARLWDAETGHPIRVFTGQNGTLSHAAFSSDGRRIVTAASDSTARVWDVETGKAVDEISLPGVSVLSAAFSVDGKRIVTVSGLKVRVWEIFANTNDLVSRARTAAPRCLSPVQRVSVFVDAEPPAWCIDMEKHPYGTQEWKDWLAHKRASMNPPLVGTQEWTDWIATHKAKGR
jgi:WD40 repeat protein